MKIDYVQLYNAASKRQKALEALAAHVQKAPEIARKMEEVLEFVAELVRLENATDAEAIVLLPDAMRVVLAAAPAQLNRARELLGGTPGNFRGLVTLANLVEEVHDAPQT